MGRKAEDQAREIVRSYSTEGFLCHTEGFQLYPKNNREPSKGFQAGSEIMRFGF